MRKRSLIPLIASYLLIIPAGNSYAKIIYTDPKDFKNIKKKEVKINKFDRFQVYKILGKDENKNFVRDDLEINLYKDILNKYKGAKENKEIIIDILKNYQKLLIATLYDVKREIPNLYKTIYIDNKCLKEKVGKKIANKIGKDLSNLMFNTNLRYATFELSSGHKLFVNNKGDKVIKIEYRPLMFDIEKLGNWKNYCNSFYK